MSLLLIVATVACADATTAPTIPPALLTRLEAIDAKVAAVHDLTASFEQQKFSPLLKKPLTSNGTIYAVGDAMLWATDKPSPTKLRIDGRSLQLLDLRQKTLEIYPLQGKLAAMAASPLPRLADLREKFDIAERVGNHNPMGTLPLTLRPRDAELKKYVDHVDVDLDEPTGVMVRFETTDPDGERTVIRFTGAKLNSGVTAKDLELNPPRDTKTVRPLDGTTP